MISRFIQKYSLYLALFLLLVMTIFAVLSIKDDSLTMDETVHIPAGYSYITKFDYRMNPEHPPLLKAYSAMPLLLVNVNFEKTYSWQVSDQWNWGTEFLFKSFNDADKLIFLARLPVISLLFLLGIYVFLWAKKLFGEKIALFVIGLYAFSPNLVAHGRLVTTDLAITCFGFITFYYFWSFLKKKNKFNLYLFYLFFSLTLLVKFSAPVIVVILLVVFLLYLLKFWGDWTIFKKELVLGIKTFIKAGIIGLVAIWFVYFILTISMPKDVALSFIDTNIKYGFLGIPESIFIKFCKFGVQNAILKPITWYIMGMAMVFAHSFGGHTTFFLGEISNSWWYYFPVIFNLKTTIPVLLSFYSFLVLMFFKVIGLISKIKFKEIFQKYYNEFYFLAPVATFFLLGMRSRLNLGVRYLLPIYPFIFFLAGMLFYYFWRKKNLQKWLSCLMIILVLWQFLCFVFIFPHFLSFFNGFIGGAENGYKYAVDSNLDWGQDLKRLASYMQEHRINKVYLSYFGYTPPEYYGINYEVLYPDSEGKIHGLVAISATNLQVATFNIDGKLMPQFDWLKKYPLVDKIGYSIFLYNIP